MCTDVSLRHTVEYYRSVARSPLWDEHAYTSEALFTEREEYECDRKLIEEEFATYGDNFEQVCFYKKVSDGRILPLTSLHPEIVDELFTKTDD